MSTPHGGGLIPRSTSCSLDVVAVYIYGVVDSLCRWFWPCRRVGDDCGGDAARADMVDSGERPAEVDGVVIAA